MPVIQFNDSDYLQTTTVEAGLYKSEVSKIEGPKASASGKSVSYYVEITITEGKYKGKTRTIVFNSGSNAPSLLGDQQYFPQSYMLLLFKATGVDDGKVKNANFDTDDLVHKPMVTNWGTATVDGRVINTINEFYPVSYGTAGAGF